MGVVQGGGWREGGEDTWRPLPCEGKERPRSLEQNKIESGDQRGDADEDKDLFIWGLCETLACITNARGRLN